ncbi:MAG: signal peptidase I [Defluviitaleaceae bacterium]|nr:signal peptidase I [Defluviitaleaceae bacterium]
MTSEIPKKTKIRKELISYAKHAVIAVLLGLFIHHFVVAVNAQVPSASMENTIMTNDRVVLNRLAYLFRDPQRYDIVVFNPPDGQEELFIKRIIGLPGETVMIFDGRVFADGVLLNDSFIKERAIGDFGPVIVPENSYFVLGDHRNNSHDSRTWQNTFLHRDEIVGRAVFRHRFNILR